MTRDQQLSYIVENLRYLPDDRVNVISTVVNACLGTPVYQTLPPERKAKIAAAIASAKSGETMSPSQAFPAIAAQIGSFDL